MCSNVDVCSSCLLPPDTSLTPHKLLHALSTVRDFWDSGLLFLFGVPYSVLIQIRDSSSYSSEDEKRMAVLQYCLQTVPGVSWGRIAGVLWSQGEHTALETVRQYLTHKPGEYTTHRVWYWLYKYSYITYQYTSTYSCMYTVLVYVHICTKGVLHIHEL